MGNYQYIGDELELFSHAKNWKAYFAELIRPYVRGRVLEVGAGIGETTRALASQDATSWTCLEPDPLLAERLQSLTLPGGKSPKVVIGTIEDLASRPAFDAVLYIDVLEHITDDARELLAARNRLVTGGHLIVLSPAFQFLFSDFDRAIGHHRRYTRRTLTSIIPPGLEPIRVCYADSAGMLLSLANKLLLRRSLPTVQQILFWDRRIIPVARRVDRLLNHSIGRSVVGVFRRR
ncbi:MAG TPA: class I SAM-dependent methyltransferase [Gemmatimonadaceae bacterium]|nr:class I SAM-dependent methyltransferase [Gemmatimonadaceae bacterium]